MGHGAATEDHLCRNAILWSARSLDLLQRPSMLALDRDDRRSVPSVHESLHGTSVWTGRALQAGFGDLETLVLRFCIRPLNEAASLLAIMDIRAHPISFSERP
jgi:hypothetical protein